MEKVKANYKMGIEMVGGNIYFDEKGFSFRPHAFNIQKKEVRVEYIDIERVSMKNTWGVIPNGMIVLETKDFKRLEHRFIVQRRNDIVDFLKQKMAEVEENRAVKLLAASIGVELEDTTLTLNDEMDGTDVQFDILDLIQYKEHKYIVLLPLDCEDEDEIVILEIEKGTGHSYLSVDDEDVLKTVFESFRERFKKALKD